MGTKQAMRSFGREKLTGAMSPYSTRISYAKFKSETTFSLQGYVHETRNAREKVHYTRLGGQRGELQGKTK